MPQDFATMDGKPYVRSTAAEIDEMKKRKHHDFDAGDTERGPWIPCATSNNPREGQWDGTKLSKRRVLDYKRYVVADGEGIRNSLYVSGCLFACEGCFQVQSWPFGNGYDYDDELEQRILDDLDHGFVQGLTLLGGEPMLNTPILLPLVRKVRERYGDTKDIWCWTGYTWEELHREGETPDKKELLANIDILVDGRFMKDKANFGLQFRGSSNQRVIDVRKSEAAGAVHIWDKLQDQKHDYKEIGVAERNQAEGVES